MNNNSLIEDVHKHIILEQQEVDFFLTLIRNEELKKKEYLLRQGSLCSNYYYLIKGCVKKFYLNNEGKERVFEFATKNQWIGDQTSLWTHSPTIFNIVALEDSEMFQIAKTNIEKLFNEIPKFERYFRLIGNKSLFKQERRIKQSLSCSAEERYRDFLQDYPGLEQRISQKEIASYLGITPEFLSNLRKKK